MIIKSPLRLTNNPTIDAAKLYRFIDGNVGFAHMKHYVHPVYNFRCQTGGLCVQLLLVDERSVTTIDTFPLSKNYFVKFHPNWIDLTREYDRSVRSERPPLKLHDIATVSPRRTIRNANDAINVARFETLVARTIDSSTIEYRIGDSQLILHLPNGVIATKDSTKSCTIKLSRISPCSTIATTLESAIVSPVRYGDYITFYLSKILSEIKLPSRDSKLYDRIVPKLRWLCRNAMDDEPRLIGSTVNPKREKRDIDGKSVKSVQPLPIY